MESIIELAKTFGITMAEIILTLVFCIQYIRKNYSSPNVGKMVPKQNKIDLEITNQMDYVKELVNADRIHLYEFHNGEHYSDYRSAYKFSCSYEVARAGKRAVRKDCVQLPISVMPRFINKITTEGKFYCDDIEKIKDSMASTYEFKNNLGIKSFYDVAIKNSEGNIIGFVAVQWDKETTPKINEQEIMKLAWLIEEKLKESIELCKKK